MASNNVGNNWSVAQSQAPDETCGSPAGLLRLGCFGCAALRCDRPLRPASAMPRLLHRKRRGATPLAASRISVEAAGGANARARLKVLGSGGRATADVPRATEDVPRATEGRGGAGAASAAGEVLAAVWDLPPLGGHDGAATELREELCRLAAVAVEQRRKEEELDLRQKQIERREAEHQASVQQNHKKDDQPPTRNQLQEQLRRALAKIDKLTKDLHKLTELEEEFKEQIAHLETLAKNREQVENEHRLKLELIESERKRWHEQEAEYLKKIEEMRNYKAAEESMKTEISQLQNEYNSRGEVIAELESKVTNLEVTNDILRENVQNLQDKITTLEQQSDELRAHIEHLERTVVRKSDEEVHILTRKVEELVERDRQSEEVILDLRQVVCHLEAADNANHEVNASLNARVQAAEIEVLGAVALRERLVELLDGVSPQDGLQTDDDILTTVTNVFNKFKMEEEHCQQRIEQLQERVSELESGKHELYYQDHHQDSGAKEVIDSLQEKLAQAQASEHEARAMLDELQAKLRYLESERQDKDMLLNLQGKVRYPENTEQMPEAYQLEQPPEHPLFQHPDELLQHPLELQHQFMQHLHPNQLQFHVPYPPEFGFQLHPRKDIPSRHHLPSLQPLQPLQPIQPMPPLPLPVPIPMHQPQLSKGARKKQRQCFKCQKFGHLAKQCSGETTCVVCGVRGHTHNECNNNEARCANCLGPHRASSKTCPVRINWCANACMEDAQLAQA